MNQEDTFVYIFRYLEFPSNAVIVVHVYGSAKVQKLFEEAACGRTCPRSSLYMTL